MLAVAHLSHARNGNGVAEKQAALKHYRDARRILDLHQQHAASAQSSDLESVKEILDELSETIESLEAEILEDTKAGQAASSSAAPEVGTTIGFGLPSSTAASSTLSATIGTKRSTAVDGPESNTAAPSTLQVINAVGFVFTAILMLTMGYDQVKKKVKPDQQGNA